MLLYVIAKLLKGQAVEGLVEVPGISGGPGGLDFYSLARHGYRSGFSSGRPGSFGCWLSGWGGWFRRGSLWLGGRGGRFRWGTASWVGVEAVPQATMTIIRAIKTPPRITGR